jgi:hypothetical protein
MKELYGRSVGPSLVCMDTLPIGRRCQYILILAFHRCSVKGLQGPLEFRENPLTQFQKESRLAIQFDDWVSGLILKGRREIAHPSNVMVTATPI